MLFPIECTCSFTCSGVLEPPQLLVRLHSKINESGEEERGRRERERERERERGREGGRGRSKKNILGDYQIVCVDRVV